MSPRKRIGIVLMATASVFLLGLGMATAQQKSTATNKPGSATIKVTGISCDGCAKSIERALTKVDGIKKVKVSYERGIAEVTYDDSKVTLDQINATIRDTGFGVAEGSGPQTAQAPMSAAGQVATAHASFYTVPLVCTAAPEIGCGSRAKPILQALERNRSVAGAWLNRPGTVIAVVWGENSTAAERGDAVTATAKESGVSMLELTGDKRDAALREFASRASWYRSSGVDRLSEEEAGIIGARVVRRVRAKSTLSEEQAAGLGKAVSAIFKRCILDPSKLAECLREEEFLNAGRKYLNETGMAALKQALSLGYRPLQGEK